MDGLQRGRQTRKEKEKESKGAVNEDSKTEESQEKTSAKEVKKAQANADGYQLFRLPGH